MIDVASSRIINEIYTTETSFLSDLAALNQKLNMLLEIPASSLSSEDRTLLMHFQEAIQGIIDSHLLANFIDEMKQTKLEEIENKSTNLISQISNDFLQHADDYYESTRSAVDSYVVVDMIIKKLMADQNPVVIEKLQSIKDNTHRDFSDYSSMPFQRPPRYAMLFNDLKKNIPDTELFNKTIDFIKQKNALLNQSILTGKNTPEALQIKRRQVLLDVINAMPEKVIDTLISDLEAVVPDEVNKIRDIRTDKSIGPLDKLVRVKAIVDTIDPIYIDYDFNREYDKLAVQFLKLRISDNDLKHKIKAFDKNFNKAECASVITMLTVQKKCRIAEVDSDMMTLIDSKLNEYAQKLEATQATKPAAKMGLFSKAQQAVEKLVTKQKKHNKKH